MAFLTLTQVTETRRKRLFRGPIVELSYRKICITNPKSAAVIFEHNFDGLPVTGISFLSGYDYYFEEKFDVVVKLVKEAQYRD